MLTFRTAALAALALAIVAIAGSRDTHATEGLYCAQDGGRGGYTNCGYFTFEQCRAAVSGVGGYCARNPAVRAYVVEDTYYRPRRVYYR